MPQQSHRHLRTLAACTLAALGPAAACSGQVLTGPVEITADVPEQAGVAVEVVLEGLERPWGMVWLPSGDMLITERPGALRLVKDGELQLEPVEGLPRDLVATGQGGLMDISLHPDFENNRFVYLTYSAGSRDANRTNIARATFDGQRLNDADVIFSVNRVKSGGQHFGSRILWLPDGTMLISIGDGGNPPVKYDGEFIRNQAQHTNSHLGKVLRLNDDGSPADGNPYTDDPDAAHEVWSFGHRNIQGLARDPDTGAIYANEHGANGGDELNRIEPAVNYGWPIATYSREYWGPRISDRVEAAGMRDPLVVWTPCIAPSGLLFYTGDDFPEWRGDLLSSGLVSEQVRRTKVQSGEPAGETKITIGKRVRHVLQGPDGGLYLLTDEQAGQLLKLVPAPASDE